MINFYLILFYATLILLSRQVCVGSLAQPLLSRQCGGLGFEIPTWQNPFMKVLVLFYTGLGGVGWFSTLGLRPGWCVTGVTGMTLASWLAD